MEALLKVFQHKMEQRSQQKEVIFVACTTLRLVPISIFHPRVESSSLISAYIVLHFRCHEDARVLPLVIQAQSCVPNAIPFSVRLCNFIIDVIIRYQAHNDGFVLALLRQVKDILALLNRLSLVSVLLLHC